MRRPSLRTAAVAAGFLAVSMIVAATATAMVSAPTRTPVASAVELPQPDPETVTPAVEARDASAGPAPESAPPVEVAADAIECSDTGVCDGSRAVDPSASAPITSNARDTDRTADAAPACVRPAAPALPADDIDREAWARAIEVWAEQWRAAARECGWDPGDWREEFRDAGPLDVEGWLRERAGDRELDGYSNGDVHGDGGGAGHDRERAGHRDSGVRERAGHRDGGGDDASRWDREGDGRPDGDR